MLSKVCLCQVLYDFSGDEAKGKIELKKDEFVQLLEKCEGGWARGRRLDGKEGFFPISFVRLVDEKEELPTSPRRMKTGSDAPRMKATTVKQEDEKLLFDFDSGIEKAAEEELEKSAVIPSLKLNLTNAEEEEEEGEDEGEEAGEEEEKEKVFPAEGSEIESKSIDSNKSSLSKSPQKSPPSSYSKSPQRSPRSPRDEEEKRAHARAMIRKAKEDAERRLREEREEKKKELERKEEEQKAKKLEKKKEEENRLKGLSEEEKKKEQKKMKQEKARQKIEKLKREEEEAKAEVYRAKAAISESNGMEDDDVVFIVDSREELKMSSLERSELQANLEIERISREERELKKAKERFTIISHSKEAVVTERMNDVLREGNSDKDSLVEAPDEMAPPPPPFSSKKKQQTKSQQNREDVDREVSEIIDALSNNDNGRESEAPEIPKAKKPNANNNVPKAPPSPPPMSVSGVYSTEMLPQSPQLEGGAKDSKRGRRDKSKRAATKIGGVDPLQHVMSELVDSKVTLKPIAKKAWVRPSRSNTTLPSVSNNADFVGNRPMSPTFAVLGSPRMNQSGPSSPRPKRK